VGKISRDFFSQILTDFANSYELLERLFKVFAAVNMVSYAEERVFSAGFFKKIGFPKYSHQQCKRRKNQEKDNTEENAAIDVAEQLGQLHPYAVNKIANGANGDADERNA
jgi:hypothetical protein